MVVSSNLRGITFFYSGFRCRSGNNQNTYVKIHSCGFIFNKGKFFQKEKKYERVVRRPTTRYVRPPKNMNETQKVFIPVPKTPLFPSLNVPRAIMGFFAQKKLRVMHKIELLF